MGHRRYLPMDHPWRRNKKIFDRTQELECAPHVQSGEEILGQLEVSRFGKNRAVPRGSRKLSGVS